MRASMAPFQARLSPLILPKGPFRQWASHPIGVAVLRLWALRISKNASGKRKPRCYKNFSTKGPGDDSRASSPESPNAARVGEAISKGLG